MDSVDTAADNLVDTADNLIDHYTGAADIVDSDIALGYKSDYLADCKAADYTVPDYMDFLDYLSQFADKAGSDLPQIDCFAGHYSEYYLIRYYFRLD